MATARPRVLFRLLVLASALLSAQGPAGPVRQPGLVAVFATTPNELRAWDSTVDRMVRGRELMIVDSNPDPDIDGRTHETLLQHRVQIERAFFRAMTMMMPVAPTMQIAAQATLQAAIDLYGANSPAAIAVRQAMQVVGLLI
jgi:hypothetical protein